MSRFITGDKSWIDSYDPEAKHSTSQWKSPNSTEKGKTGEEKSKEHAHNYLAIKGIVHKEFVLAE
jgi:hypothetical protein